MATETHRKIVRKTTAEKQSRNRTAGTGKKTHPKSKKISSCRKKAVSEEEMIPESEQDQIVPEAFPGEENSTQNSLSADEGQEKLLSAGRSTEKCDTFKLYVKEASSISRISVEDEIHLSHQIHHGSEEESSAAREQLISANLLLVVKIAHDFKGMGLELQDLISEGNIGLMRAAEKFDPSKGAKFSSYAAWWIKQSMRRSISNLRSVIRVPVQSACKLAAIRRAMRSYIMEKGKNPSVEELAVLTDLSIRTVRSLLLADHRVISLQEQIREGEDGVMMELLEDSSSPAPDRDLQESELLSQMQHLLYHLNDREREILELRYGLHGTRPLTLEEVSRKIGRTRERVRQLQNQALGKLRSLLLEEKSENPSYASAS